MRREALLRSLVAQGALPDPAWRAAFEAVPRELFVPCYYLGTYLGHERRCRDDPGPGAYERWLDGCYEDVPLAVSMGEGELLSSSSQPSLMARMLHALEVADGMTVLEIGTGTGWNAGLLCHRLGEQRVTTIDVDPQLTDSARRHLADAGYAPTVVTGDGYEGCPERAPFDRIIATCALSAVPTPWLDQSAAGGLVIAPLATGVIALRVDEPGRGEGRFLSTSAYFVPLRGAGYRPEPLPRMAGVPGHVLADDSFRFLLALAAESLTAVEAYDVWRRERRPDRSRFGVTATAERQWAWLDDPRGPHRWPLPDGPPDPTG
ncbi:methyltransferase domain-containing protein [Streptomyces durbertensis]|uniref:Protein-L-isoaspartate O-methyltransferase n=1 Tax=Streptomyces durbertensis TaxID=2448886 RepID=A0ABR6EDU4_9ACTN|nr:methyltransferase domain-containing protein [Streptomyces durbertensis]MBB1243242.1 methyltransferase domain-containing protein [Streptomyces durbertensis]